MDMGICSSIGANLQIASFGITTNSFTLQPKAETRRWKSNGEIEITITGTASNFIDLPTGAPPIIDDHQLHAIKISGLM